MISLKDFLFSITHLLSDAGPLLQPSSKKILLVMAGGSLGAVSRYGVSLLAAKLWGT